MLRGIMLLFLGAVAGAILALLFAPQSGQEFRAGFQTVAVKQQEKLRAEWQARMAQPSEEPDQTEADLTQAPQQAPGEGESGVES